MLLGLGMEKGDCGLPLKRRKAEDTRGIFLVRKGGSKKKKEVSERKVGG